MLCNVIETMQSLVFMLMNLYHLCVFNSSLFPYYGIDTVYCTYHPRISIIICYCDCKNKTFGCKKYGFFQLPNLGPKNLSTSTIEVYGFINESPTFLFLDNICSYNHDMLCTHMPCILTDQAQSVLSSCY